MTIGCPHRPGPEHRRRSAFLIATRSVMVNTPVEVIWSTPVDKAEHPEKYLPNKPEFFKIHQTFPNGLLREMKTAEMHLFERVTFDKAAGVVKFAVENHPIYSGFFLEKVTPPEDPGGLPLLTLTMDLQPRSETAEQQPEAQWFFTSTLVCEMTVTYHGTTARSSCCPAST